MVVDEIQTTEVGYVVVRNTTGEQQSVDVLFESDDDPVLWETYELAPEQVVELNGFDHIGDYRVSIQWDGTTRSERLKSGRRAIAIVLATVSDEVAIIRDAPFSSLDPSQRNIEDD
jgi:hypothetical protein